MPTISVSKQYSVSKNIRLFLMAPIGFGQEAFDAGCVIPTSTATGVDDMEQLWNLPASWTWPQGASQGNSFYGYFFNQVPNLQEIPDLSTEGSIGETDTIEITTLEDEFHEYADGLKNHADEDNGSISFTFLFDAGCYEILHRFVVGVNKQLAMLGPDHSASRYFRIYAVLPDCSFFVMKFKNLSLTFNGAGTNAALTFALNVGLNGGVKFVPQLQGSGSTVRYNYEIINNVPGIMRPYKDVDEEYNLGDGGDICYAVGLDTPASGTTTNVYGSKVWSSVYDF